MKIIKNKEIYNDRNLKASTPCRMSRTMMVIKFLDITHQMNLVKNKIITRSYHIPDTSQ